MGKESLERLPDEQIEAISGGKKDSSEELDWTGVKCPRCGKFIPKEELKNKKISPFNGTIVCPICYNRFSEENWRVHEKK